MRRVASSFVLALAIVTDHALAALPSGSTRSAARPAPQVDLGYAVYEGVYNDTYNLNTWKSIRYAAPPIGNLRWQAPQPPLNATTRNRIVPAVDQPPWCPQSGAYGVPSVYGFNSNLGNEDCLYLNVYAPPAAENLPVFVWIHGGGYSVFSATYNPSSMIDDNNNGFITVEIQYRLGAFGQLASANVRRHGKLNVGLLDQRYALEWVQKYISKFGGDPTRVTLGGESSGAGSVMYQSLAYGGEDSGLFNNIILASTYVPPIYQFNDSVPTSHFNDFAAAAGCGETSPIRKHHSSVFDCLVAADTKVLQNASGLVSTTNGYFGSFSWLPVIDHDMIRYRPSEQLQLGQISGKCILIGTNANEGVPLANPNVTTKSEFDAFISSTLPHLTTSDILTLNQLYDTATAKAGNNGTRFDTTGDSGPTANTVSGMATGIQQTAFNVAAESIFQCPSQWIAEAFSSGRQAWKYQYSLDPAYHGADLGAYFVSTSGLPNPGFQRSFHKIWGNFIINDTPVIRVKDATGGMANATVPIDANHPDQISWPQYSMQDATFMNFNTTGGEVSLVTVTDELSYYVRGGAGIVNSFRLANATTWEGRRGDRCRFWQSIAPRVPN
ncbi:probable secreted lipase ARB_02369 [Trichoderma asperellum]|uniref:Carboxylic ester hydrolase n=1 Tax=Trichoderma asperellum TaxID=101201 RepID=A0A6V8R9J5_TRIAP|nr:probable secreted lipase ARB_02369 [Trichoderma asperellum]